MLPTGLYPGTPVETFLDNGERVMATPVYAFDMKALIFRAVRDNQPRVVEYLLNISKITHDAHDINGNTMLYVAAQSNAVDVLRLLLMQGARANDASSSNGEATLFAAVRAGAEPAVSLLVRYSDVTIRNIEGDTVLHVAAKAGHTKIIAFLLQSDASIDAKNHQGQTPIWLAVHNQHIDAACCLLQHNANPRLRDLHGVSAIDEAVANVRRVIDTFVKSEYAGLLPRE